MHKINAGWFLFHITIFFGHMTHFVKVRHIYRSVGMPNYCVNYYDYIVKWCSGIACHWCVLLDIA